MPNIVNRMVTAELEHEFADAEGMLLVSYSGLETVENEELRGKLAEKNVRFRMVRNSLAKRVLAAKGYEFPEAEALKGKCRRKGVATTHHRPAWPPSWPTPPSARRPRARSAPP